MTSSSATHGLNRIARVRIELKGSNPLIWRVVEVPVSITLNILHDIVQASMGWEDCHAWEFVIDGRPYGPPGNDDYGEAPRHPAYRTWLAEMLPPGSLVIDYVYDFGDDWRHRLIISDVRQGKADLAYPRFIAGEGNCPPENCGGIEAYHAMLEARSDPKHPDHAQIRELLDSYDPSQLDLVSINDRLDRIATRRKKPHASIAAIDGQGPCN